LNNSPPLPETELDSLNAKRLKNREAARRWRQGKKDQISDLQGEVYTLKNKIDAMQTEMETLRIENQYLKQELHKTRQPQSQTQPPPQSPLLSYSSHPFRIGASTPPPHSNDHPINFLPTPSIFLLCLFVFSLCLALPPSVVYSSKAFPGSQGHQTTEDYLLSSSSLGGSARQPRLFYKPGDHPPKILSSECSSGHYWIFSMFNEVYQRLLPVEGGHGNLDEVGLFKVPLGEMNKRISLRLDKFL